MPIDEVRIEGPKYGVGLACEKVLRNLPDWFGLEEALQNYVVEANELPTFVATLNAETVGFMSVKIHFSKSAELYVLGVMRERHRQGIGRQLLAACERYLIEQGIRFVQVKTLAASAGDPGYERTRKFYESSGYLALEEFPELWDPQNPCLQMIKSLQAVR